MQHGYQYIAKGVWMFAHFRDNPVLIDTLRDYIERKLTPFGLPEYAYTVVSKKDPSKILIISSYPEEWVNLYRKNNFQHIDPVILTAYRRASPFTWDENITLMTDLKAAKIFSLSKKYNIVNGFTFVVHDHLNNVSLLSLIIKKEGDDQIEKTISGGMDKLQMALIEINEQMYKLVHSHSSRSLNSPHGIYESKEIFTPQEKKVLHWASLGKTYQEIAEILSISSRTVKFHMGNIKSKMGVNNARSAIRLSVELNLINELEP